MELCPSRRPVFAVIDAAERPLTSAEIIARVQRDAALKGARMPEHVIRGALTWGIRTGRLVNVGTLGRYRYRRAVGRGGVDG